MAGPDRTGPGGARTGARPRRRAGSLTEERQGPILDLRARWRVGQILLALAGLLALLAAFRPLAPGASPWLRLAALLLLAMGVVAAPLLAALRARSMAEQLALYAFLILSADAFGQLLGPMGWPIWPAMALIVAAIAVAEPPWVAFGAAARPVKSDTRASWPASVS